MKRILTSLLLCAMLVCSFVMPVAASGLFPSNFTPSVTAKTAPEIVPYEKEDVEYAGTLVRIGEDGSETVVKDVLSPKVSVVGYANINQEGVSDAVAERMMAAYDEISGAEDIGALCPALLDIVKEIHPDQKTTDLVASDLFDLALSGEELAMLEGNDDIVFRVTFQFKLGEGEPAPVIMHRTSSGGVWEAIPYDSVKISGEDRITVDFSGLCPVTFLRVGAPEVVTPINFDGFFFVLGAVILSFLLIILIRAIVLSVKRRNRRAAIIESEEGFLEGYYRMSEHRYAPTVVHKSNISIERINGDDE